MGCPAYSAFRIPHSDFFKGGFDFQLTFCYTAHTVMLIKLIPKVNSTVGGVVEITMGNSGN